MNFDEFLIDPKAGVEECRLAIGRSRGMQAGYLACIDTDCRDGKGADRQV